MAFTFADIKSEILRRATRDQSGTQFATAAANLANTSMWSVARFARWKQLRRETTFNTVASYADTASPTAALATVTLNSAIITCPNATFYTNGVGIGRYIKISGSAKFYRIAQVTSQTGLVLDQIWDGASSSTAIYGVLPQEYYTLPLQIGHEAFFWHRAYGYPLMLTYVPTQDFYMSGVLDILTNVPLGYRMWGCDSSVTQPGKPQVLTLSSTSTSDTGISITIFGIVNGLPDYEVFSTNGTTSVVGLKSFSTIDRVTKNVVSVGVITVTADSATTTVCQLPVGNTTTGPLATKIQLYPLPYRVFPINCLYYKEPFKMVNDNDIHELGEQFDEAIILLATAKMKAEQGLTADSQNFMNLYRVEMDTLRRVNVDKVDWYPKLQAPKGNYWNAWTGGLRYAQVGGQGQFGPSSMQ